MADWFPDAALEKLKTGLFDMLREGSQLLICRLMRLLDESASNAGRVCGMSLGGRWLLVQARA